MNLLVFSHKKSSVHGHESFKKQFKIGTIVSSDISKIRVVAVTLTPISYLSTTARVDTVSVNGFGSGSKLCHLISVHPSVRGLHI